MEIPFVAQDDQLTSRKQEWPETERDVKPQLGKEMKFEMKWIHLLTGIHAKVEKKS